MQSYAYYIICISIISVPLDDAYKILIFNPRLGKSHVRFVGRIADALIEAGHNVTLLSPGSSPLVNITGSKLAETIRIEIDRGIMDKFNMKLFIQNAWEEKQQSFFGGIRLFHQWANLLVKICELQLKQEKIMEQLKSEKFDLAISEFDPCAFGMAELFQIPAHILVSASGLIESVAELIGMPNFPSYVPNKLTTYTEKMSYFERVMNLMYSLFSKIWLERIIAKDQQLFRQLYGEQFVDLKEKVAQVTYVLTNVEPFFDFPKPTIHKLLELGGVTVPKVKPLNEKWTAVVNQRKAVVLVSFGTVALSYLMPNETKRALLKAFDEFPDVTFIWKYEKKHHRIADGHPNVVTDTWLPQPDLLAHPNLVAFVTHGGMNSITEALNYGKPVIVIPLFADQLSNGVLTTRSGFGITLSISELREEGKLRDALDKIIHDTNYAGKAERLSRMIAKKPNPAKEQLIKHIEFAAEFGQIPNFDPYGRKMSFIPYYMLDIIVPIILLVLLLTIGLFYSLFRLLRRLIPGSNSENGNASTDDDGKKENKKNQ